MTVFHELTVWLLRTIATCTVLSQVTAAMTAKVQKLKAFYSKENKPSACAKINES